MRSQRGMPHQPLVIPDGSPALSRAQIRDPWRERVDPRSAPRFRRGRSLPLRRQEAGMTRSDTSISLTCVIPRLVRVVTEK